MMFSNGNLKDVKLIKNDYQPYFHHPYSLIVTYENKDEYGNIHEIVIKNVDLPIYLDPKYISYESEVGYCCTPERSIDIGYGKISFSENTTIEDRIIKYAVKEMTIEEIEKKLGHKVKVISKEDKK